jgi:hypothetical protein
MVSVVVLLVPVAAVASHQFKDVPDSNIFHNDIAWMSDNGITEGCNPPANDMYNVTREQMAAFMHRLATSRAVDAGTVEGMTAADLKGQKGDKGDTGATGPAGADGAAGPPGADGQDGAPGGLSGLERVVASDTLTPANVGDTVVAEAVRPSGKMVTGGGGTTISGGVVVGSSIPKADLTGWNVLFEVLQAHASVTVYAEAICADVPTP